MNGKRSLQFIVLSVAFLSACGVTTAEPTTAIVYTPRAIPTPEMVEHSTITAHSYPRVDGSTSTLPLQVMIACTLLDVRCAWNEGDFFDTALRIAPVDYLVASDQNEAIFKLNHSGTHGAYNYLVEKNADLILVAREPSDDELVAAENEGVELDLRPVALDAFVFLVHSDNPVQSLTLQQIRDIYTGRITNWAAVGGLDAEIHTYQRNPNSGSQELMEKLVMRGEAMLDSTDMILLSMMGPFSVIRYDPLGIGYSVYFYAANIYPEERVKMLAIDGIRPAPVTISGHTYPLVTQVYAVLREDTPGGHPARVLRDLLRSREGQKAVEASGYVGFLGG